MNFTTRTIKRAYQNGIAKAYGNIDFVAEVRTGNNLSGWSLKRWHFPTLVEAQAFLATV